MKEEIIDLVSKVFYNSIEETPKSRLEEVISGYKQIILQNPDESKCEEWELWWELGCILDELGHSGEAFTAYQQVIHLNPYCEPVYEKAIEIQPENYELWWQLASNIYARQGNLEKAVEAYQRVVKFNPNFLPAYYNLLELQGDNWDIWWQLGKALDKDNQLEQAVVAYHHAMVFNPDFEEEYYNHLVSNRYVLGKTSQDDYAPPIETKVEEIKSDLTKTYIKIAKRLTDINVYRQLTQTWKRQGNLNKVITLWQKLVEEEPSNVDYIIEMANTLVALERREEALNSYFRANQVYFEEVRRSGKIGRLFLSTLPKSGGQYLALSLQKGLGINQVPVPGSYSISFDEILFLPFLDATLDSSQDVLIVSHALSNDFNRVAITQYVDRLIVNVRDPRQATLSNTHNLNLIHRHSGKEQLFLSLQLPHNYFLWSLPEQITWQIEEGFLPNAIKFMQGWLEADRDPKFYPPILFTRYEDLVENPENYFETIVEFYGIKKSRFKFPERPKFNENTHNRKGEIDEWRSVFTPEQAEKACSMIPENIYIFFNWPPN